MAKMFSVKAPFVPDIPFAIHVTGKLLALPLTCL
jgi:hypothetical protein